jgi:hypothetical protein
VYTSTSTSLIPAYFENTIGRLSVHSPGHHITIAYHQGPRQAAELHAFLIKAGNLLTYWGWDKLPATQATMLAFSPEEMKEVCAYWRTIMPHHPALLHGVLLLPHEVLVGLSHLAD